jgi:hypothetical protein
MSHRHLRKRWRPVKIESTIEQKRLHQHHRGCKGLNPVVTWGDARLSHREFYGGTGRRAEYSGYGTVPVIQPSSYTTPPTWTERKVRFAQSVDSSNETASYGETERIADPSTSNRRFRCIRFGARTAEMGESDESRDLAAQWTAFEYSTQPYVSVWKPIVQRKGLFARFKSSISELFNRKTSPPRQVQFRHANPLHPSEYPMLPRFGAQQYHPDTVGADTLTTNGMASWIRTDWGGRSPSRTFLHGADSWFMGHS